MPIVKKLMDSSQGDSIIRFALARKLADLAKVGASLLEVAQGSSIRLRHEIREKRKMMRQMGIRDSVDVSFIQ